MRYKTRRYVIYYAGRVLIFVLHWLPLPVVVSLGALAGDIVCSFVPRYRNMAREHLRRAFPDKTETACAAIARESFRNLGRNLAEFLNIRRIARDHLRYVRVDGIEHLEKALARGKGTIILTGHIGNWELLPLVLTRRGFWGGVIVKPVYFNRFDQYLARLRGVTGIEIIDRRRASTRIVRLLHAGKLIGVLADQDVDSVEGVFVPFFGTPAYTPSAPVQLALRTGAAIVPCFMVREKERRHRLLVKPEMELVVSGDMQRDIEVNTARWSALFEEHIRAYPDQWVWMHRRWKTKQRTL